MSRSEGGGRERGWGVWHTTLLLHVSCAEARQRNLLTASEKPERWDWWMRSKKQQKRSADLLCVVWTSGGYRRGSVGLLLLLLLLLRSRSSSSFYNTVQSALYKTANINTANTPRLKYMTSPHSTESRGRERERERERERYAFRSSCFTLWPAPSLFLLFPTQIVIPYLGEGRERKERERHVTGGAWCGHWKEFSRFLPRPQKNETGLGGRDDKILENSSAVWGEVTGREFYSN